MATAATSCCHRRRRPLTLLSPPAPAICHAFDVVESTHLVVFSGVLPRRRSFHWYNFLVILLLARLRPPSLGERRAFYWYSCSPLLCTLMPSSLSPVCNFADCWWRQKVALQVLDDLSKTSTECLAALLAFKGLVIFL